jgi:hypothetical protein
MIEINLLPEELRIARQKAFLPQEYALYGIIAVCLVLFIIHSILIGVTIIRGVEFGVVSSVWNKLGPQRKQVKAFRQQYGYIFDDAGARIDTGSRNADWSEKLCRISLDVPAGLWLKELSLAEKNFILKGSIIASGKNEIVSINQFMSVLKNDRRFMEDISSLELGPLTRRVIGGYDVVDFTFNGQVKQ